VRLFFVLAAVFHFACLVLRFDELAAVLPPGVSAGLLWATFPLVLLEGWLDAKTPEAERGRAAKAAYTFAFAFLAVVIVQAWDLEIGPINPSPPKEWDTATRARFFLTMSAGLCFPFWLASKSVFVPALRWIGAQVGKLPGVAAIFALGTAGMGLGAGFVLLIASKTATGEIKGAKAAWKAFTEQPWIALGLGLGGVIGPVIWAAIKGKLRPDATESQAETEA